MPEKKDPYTSPATKAVSLYSVLLFTGKKYSLSQLAALFRCSKQTILRMIEQLEMAREIQIESWTERGKRWYKAKTPVVKPNVALRVEDIQLLLLCRDLIWKILPQQLQMEVSKTIANTTVLLPEFNKRTEAMTSYGQAYLKGRIDYTKSHDFIETLLKAMRKQCLCNIEYQSHPKTKPKMFSAAPLKLIAYKEGLYIKCRREENVYDSKSVNDLLLAVHRIKSVFVTDKKYKIPKEELEKQSDTFGFIEGEPFKVKVALKPSVSYYVAERIWSADQTIKHLRDGGIVLEFTATSRNEVINWVLSFGVEAELLSPEDIRTEIKNALKETLNMYN